MTNKEPIIMSWSGGKDATHALYELMNSGQYEVQYLLTNIHGPNKRVSMHGVPESLIVEQAHKIGIPLKIMYLSEGTNVAYEKEMKTTLTELKQEGIHKVAFGDIFLQDLRQYRESRLAEVGMQGIFPIWGKKTNELANRFIELGFNTHICSINAQKVPEKLIGNDFDAEFLQKLPPDIDPCGEHGEFHSFCYDGPIFKERVNFSINGTSEQVYEHLGEKHRYLFSDISLSY